MKQEELLLGVDIGTQGVKGALVNARGRIAAEHFIEQSCIYPQPGWAEHDMLQNWWLNPVKVIRKLLRTEGVKAAQVRAVCASGLHPNLGVTDEHGNPLRNAILYSDHRAVAELKEVNERKKLKLTSEEITPKLIWVLRHEPHVAERIRMCFDAAAYLVYRLCGEHIYDTISAGGWGAIYHSPTASWREDICEEFDIPVRALPKVYPPLTIVGWVHHEASEATGLAVGTPVLAGCNDVTASTISAGATRTWEAIAYYGTAGLLPVMKEEMEIALRLPYRGEEVGLRAYEGYLFDYPAYCLTTGDSLRWFRDEFGQAEMQAEQEGGLSAYARFDQLAEKISPGAEGLIFLPYLLGQRSPVFNPQAQGMFYGLRRTHQRAHFIRAIMEAWGYTIRYGLETTYPQGQPLKRLIATGGGARSRLWRQIVSDISGLPQEYAPQAEGSLADAYLAGMAIGWFVDFETLLSEWIKIQEVTLPNPERQAVYTHEYYPKFVKMHEIMKHLE